MSKKGDLDGRRLKPSIQKSRHRWRVQPDSSIDVNKIVIASGTDTPGVYMTVALAANTQEPARRQTLYVAQAGTSASGKPTLEVASEGLITGVDTSGGAVGDPVYLGTSGGFVLTAAGNERLIGRIVKSSATAGVIEFNGNLSNGATDEDFTTATVNIANAATSGFVTVGAAWNGAIVTAAPSVNANNVAIRSAIVAAGDLTVTMTGAIAAGTAVIHCMLWKGTVGTTDA
jgi:hypothetical protein